MKYGEHEAFLAHQKLERVALVITRVYTTLYFTVLRHRETYPERAIEEMRQLVRNAAQDDWGKEAKAEFFEGRVRISDGASRVTDIFDTDPFPEFPDFY